ncbi:DUF3492 domain-containing protein, partial [Streptomyces olivaceoviridis]
MRIGLVTEGGYPYVGGDAMLWCDRLVHGLDQHEFDVYALSRGRHQETEGLVPLPPQVGRVRTAPLWTAADDGVTYGRRARRRFAEYYGELVAAVCAGAGTERTGSARAGVGSARASEIRSQDAPAVLADRFGSALYALAELAREEGGLVAALRSDAAVRTLERACRAPPPL